MDIANCYLDGNADAVAFCPHAPFHHVLATATYTLLDQDEIGQSRRVGSISLFSVNDTEGLNLLYRVETAGIFDIKWNSVDDGRHPILAQADTDGCLILHSLRSEAEISLNELCSETVTSSMCLYVDWNATADSLSLGLSDGSLSVVTVGESQLEPLTTWLAHKHEVWTCCFDVGRPYLVYSGSDDCCLSCWDLRENVGNHRVFCNAKAHGMGVCCIAQDPTNSNLLLTGSYDEFLRVWDVRVQQKPVAEKSLNLGGGVWRIKCSPDNPDVVLTANMHSGFAVVKIGPGEPAVMEMYRKHESLAYGVDWQRRDGRPVVATCSFYDRLLRVWQPNSL